MSILLTGPFGPRVDPVMVSQTGAVLVTGANGFVGEALCEQLRERGYAIKRAVRLADRADSISIGDIASSTDWTSALQNCRTVVHLAARVHIMQDTTSDSLAAFRKVNTAGTLALAEQAAKAGIERFIFLSSVKVNGEATGVGSAFDASTDVAPKDPYGLSKFEAELGLRRISAATGMEIVIIRPPLIYGPGVKANFHAMMRWLYRGIPLPLGGVKANRRSLLALDNLTDLLITCLKHPAAGGQTFMASDGDDLSTTDLLSRMGLALGKPARLIVVPPALLAGGARMIGRGDLAQRLLGSLQVDIRHTRETLGWTPPIGVDEALYRTARAFLP